jgi:hypothetical protein
MALAIPSSLLTISTQRLKVSFLVRTIEAIALLTAQERIL